MKPEYTSSLTQYQRRKTIVVPIGDIALGGDNPIRVQSMTTVDTMDTKGSIEQCIRMIESGCEYIRITAPSVKEAENLKNIKAGLALQGYKIPLIADIHFTPNAAEMAAKIVEKVRINPGNYIDKKKFQITEYDDASYQEELDKLRTRFLPLLKICKEYGTAIRIGTNHGSLSDRIMSRFGDTPNGMVESALEFLRICEDESFHNVVISMKSSNAQVMVQAYRLLVARMDQEGFQPYPLHLGVTEAGDGEDGRIKSSVGIGTLLEDGLGDTVRVSLTEDPEFEAPVARALVDRYTNRISHQPIEPYTGEIKSPYEYHRRNTAEFANIGFENVPRVIADLSRGEVEIAVNDLKEVGHFYMPLTDKWAMNDFGVDFIYSGKRKINFMLPNGVKEITDYPVWQNHDEQNRFYPLFTPTEWMKATAFHKEVNFVRCDAKDLSVDLCKAIQNKPVVLILKTDNEHAMAALRRGFYTLANNACNNPVCVERVYPKNISEENFQLYAATDVGGLLIDGFGDGIMLSYEGMLTTGIAKKANQIAFGVLQAARTRMSKTEYISCPSCGRTLFDLQETTAMIRKRTDHLKGVKIGIMGCIVNGPGEMADADYGYVGSGPDKITLYKGQEVMKKNVPSANAVDELIEIIRKDGRWLEPAKPDEVLH